MPSRMLFPRRFIGEVFAEPTAVPRIRDAEPNEERRAERAHRCGESDWIRRDEEPPEKMRARKEDRNATQYNVGENRDEIPCNRNDNIRRRRLIHVEVNQHGPISLQDIVAFLDDHCGNWLITILPITAPAFGYPELPPGCNASVVIKSAVEHPFATFQSQRFP